MSKPLVIIINGKGGVGKDSVCKVLQKYIKYTHVYSSITPIKAMAEKVGWKGEKTNRARKFLSDLKDLCTEYNDYPLEYMDECLRISAADPHVRIVCFHIREPEEIKKFKRWVIDFGYNCMTLLIRSNRINKEFGNRADDEAENYSYDCIYYNDGPLKSLDEDFMKFFEANIGAQE